MGDAAAAIREPHLEYSSAKCIPPYLTSRTADKVLEYFCWKVPSNEWTEFRAFKNLDRKKIHFYFLHYLIEISVSINDERRQQPIMLLEVPVTLSQISNPISTVADTSKVCF